jgi:hypothetical protein
MDLHPWRLWSLDGRPIEGTDEILAVLESVLRRDPNHLAANHYYIHATEARRQQSRRLIERSSLMSPPERGRQSALAVGSCLPSLSSRAPGRPHPRWEPDAGSSSWSGSEEGVISDHHPTPTCQTIMFSSLIALCRKCAVRFEPIRANTGSFATPEECFRAGLVVGKSLKRLVS